MSNKFYFEDGVTYLDDEELDFDDDIRVYRGEPFTGVAISYFENGGISSEIPHLNGLPHGVCREWFKNGTKKREWNAVKGTVHGACNEWLEGGGNKSVGNYIYGAEIDYKEWGANESIVVERRLAQDSPMYSLIEKLKIFYSDK